MKAHLMSREEDPYHGITEIWQAEDGEAIYVDYNVHISETMAFPYDTRRDKVTSWTEIGVWRRDMTGGRAMRELGYEPVEIDERLR